MKGVPAFSYLSPNTEQIPVVTDIRNLLRHSPNGSEPPAQKGPPHFYQYHQHLQYQPSHSPKDISWSSSPEMISHRKLAANEAQQEKAKGQPPPQKSSMFSFNFLHKTPKDPAAQKGGEKENAKRDRNKDKKRSPTEVESRLIESYLSNPQRSKKNGLTLQQQYFQSQQQKLQASQRQQSVASRRILESHSYQNVSDEDRHRSQTPKSEGHERVQPQMFRRFGDTNLLSARNSPARKEHNSSSDGHSEENHGAARPHITSFADYANRSDISKYLNIDVKSASHSSAYSSGSNMSPPSQGNKNMMAPRKSPLNRSSPSLLHSRHHNHHDHSSSSSLMSDKSSCSSSSMDQRSYFIGEPHEYGSYLGPFNFRQLLRPTQGPTESLRKRKGVNTNSPPPPQRGKSFI